MYFQTGHKKRAWSALNERMNNLNYALAVWKHYSCESPFTGHEKLMTVEESFVYLTVVVRTIVVYFYTFEL